MSIYGRPFLEASLHGRYKRLSFGKGVAGGGGGGFASVLCVHAVLVLSFGESQGICAQKTYASPMMSPRVLFRSLMFLSCSFAPHTMSATCFRKLEKFENSQQIRKLDISTFQRSRLIPKTKKLINFLGSRLIRKFEFSKISIMFSSLANSKTRKSTIRIVEDPA